MTSALTPQQGGEVFDPWAFVGRIGVLFERVEGLEFWVRGDCPTARIIC
jgi:hypothetical protein